MATTRGATNGRERVGQSSSPPTSAKANPKPVPSYLRSTKSSKSLDSPTNPKNSNTGSSTPKQPITAARRRSLDRPPSTSQIQRTIPGAREAKPTRSSSFSASTKMAPAVKRVEPQLSKSRSLSTKVALPSKVGNNKDSSSSSRVSRLKKKSGPKSVTSESSNDFSDNHSIEHLVSDDDIAYTQHDIQSLPEISEMPDSNEELKDPTNQDLEAKHIVEEKTEDDQEDEKPTPEIKVVTDEPEPQQQEIETPEKEQETITEDVQKNEEQNDRISEEKQEESPVKENEEEEKKDEELVVEEEDKGEEKTEVEEDKGEEKTEVEEDKKENVGTPSPPPSTTVKARQPSPKKENQDYNDVIEQTASKMMGKKNRVLALAGAFETVISLQDKN